MDHKIVSFAKKAITVVAKQLLYYLSKDGFRRRVRYTRNYKHSKIRRHMILYESFHGASMNDSPYAIFKHLVHDPRFKGYTHVWALNKTENNLYFEKYSNYKNVKFVQVNSRQYIRSLTRAKYLINSVTFPPYFQKKPGQIYVNTWHGTPLKTLGKDMHGAVSQLKNIQRNFLHSDFIISPNAYTTEVIANAHDLKGIYSGKIIEEGYPRIDQIRNTERNQFFNKILSKVVNVDKNKKTILYAPTWRGSVNHVTDIKTTIAGYIKDLYDKMPEQYQLILKVHSLIYKYIEDDEFLAKICVPNWVDTDELLTNVDLLITDYSSIFFDYLVTDKPIIFFNYDEEEYVRERGVYLDLNTLPGPRCYTIDQVIDAISKQSFDRYREKYQNYKRRFCSNDLNNCTEKYIDAIFYHQFKNKKVKSIEDRKKNLLMYCGGFLNNGITSSAINLSYNLDYEKYNLIVIDKGNYTDESEANIRRLHPNAKRLYRVGGINTTMTEWFFHLYTTSRGFNPRIHKLFHPETIYKRELRRMTGETTRIDIAIDFSGYVPFWTAVLGYSDVRYKSIYQHNDMYAETQKVINGRLKHKKRLSVVFSLYRFFDKVISVGKETRNLNAENLKIYVDPDKIVYVPNSINSEAILESVKNDPTIIEKYKETNYMLLEKTVGNGLISLKGIELPEQDAITFVTMGRLSPEKDQAKLIRAFSAVQKKYPDLKMKLYIIGSGVLETALKQLVARLNVEHVIFTGQLRHPFRLIRYCSCFVLSSNHEGQPMVLLETMVMDKPIIATDIPGSRSVLSGNYGKLVPNSVEGLADGMNAFIQNGEIKRCTFDYKKYNQRAMDLFYRLSCGAE